MIGSAEPDNQILSNSASFHFIKQPYIEQYNLDKNHYQNSQFLVDLVNLRRLAIRKSSTNWLEHVVAMRIPIRDSHEA